MKVSEIMNKAVVVEDATSLKQAVGIMSEKRIGSLIVMKSDKIIGIITERDILRNVSKLGEKISNIMSKDIITIEANESIDKAAEVMGKNQIKRLPVVKKGQLVGIITATDVLANSEELNEEFFIE